MVNISISLLQLITSNAFQLKHTLKRIKNGQIYLTTHVSTFQRVFIKFLIKEYIWLEMQNDVCGLKGKILDYAVYKIYIIAHC